MWGRLATASILCCACGRLGFDATDGAPSDAPGDAGPVGNRVFVTSTVQTPTSFGGISGADAICSARATAAGLPGRFLPYLSISTMNVRDRLAGARGWYRVDGAPVADTLEQLFQRGPIMPLDLDEHGDRIAEDDPAYVTTGSYEGAATATCSDYTNGAEAATSGRVVYTGGGWSNVNVVACSEQSRLYCFQTDYALPVAYPRATGRIAFLSSAEFTPSSGIAAADAICSNEAAGAGVPGSFAALLPDNGPAAARFDATGAPWVRIDGIVLAPTAVDFLAGRSTAALNVLADGTFVDAYVESGGYPATDPQDLMRSCDNWTNPAGGNAFGHATGIGITAYVQTTTDCMTAARVYCLQR